MSTWPHLIKECPSTITSHSLNHTQYQYHTFLNKSFVWVMSMQHVTHSGPEIVALWVQYWSHMLQGFDISGRGKHLFPYLPQRIKYWRLRVRGRRFAETAAQYPNYRKPRGDCKGGRRCFRFGSAPDQHFWPVAKHAGQSIIILSRRKRSRWEGFVYTSGEKLKSSVLLHNFHRPCRHSAIGPVPFCFTGVPRSIKLASVRICVLVYFKV